VLENRTVFRDRYRSQARCAGLYGANPTRCSTKEERGSRQKKNSVSYERDQDGNCSSESQLKNRGAVRKRQEKSFRGRRGTQNTRSRCKGNCLLTGCRVFSTDRKKTSKNTVRIQTLCMRDLSLAGGNSTNHGTQRSSYLVTGEFRPRPDHIPTGRSVCLKRPARTDSPTNEKALGTQAGRTLQSTSGSRPLNRGTWIP